MGASLVSGRLPVRAAIPSGVSVDVIAMERTVAAAEQALARGNARTGMERAQASVALYGGPFAAGLEAEWLERARRQSEGLHDRALELTATCALAIDDPEAWRGGVQRARELCTLQPYLERAHLLLMRLLVTVGDRVQALSVYDTLRWRLGHELGVIPGPELRELHAGLVADDESPTPPAVSNRRPRLPDSADLAAALVAAARWHDADGPSELEAMAISDLRRLLSRDGDDLLDADLEQIIAVVSDCDSDPCGERDRALLELLRPHLVSAYRNSQLRAQAQKRIDAPGRAIAGHPVSHRPVTADGEDAWPVARLRDAANRALARGIPHVATEHLRRALAKPPPEFDRPGVLAELALAAARAGAADAIELLREAIVAAPTPRGHAELALTLSRMLAVSGAGAGARRAPLRAALAKLGRNEAELRPALEAELIATLSRTVAARTARKRLRGLDALTGGTAAERLLLATLALESAYANWPAPETAALAARALGRGALIAEQSADAPACYAAIHALVAAEELDDAKRFLGAALEDARRRGSAFGFALASMCRSHTQLVSGQVDEAIADGRAALALATENGWQEAMPWIAGFLINALIERDELDAAEAELARPELAPWLHNDAGLDPLLLARGRVRLERGHFAAARDDLFRCGIIRRRARADSPGVAAWRTDAALACRGMGDDEQALALADQALRRARHVRAPGALGRALRVRGLVAPGLGDVKRLSAAAEMLANSPLRLEHARALVDLGARLRRDDHTTAASQSLHLGLALARRCGALRLARRASAELAAAGVRR
jgi:tetratricopeptide (TPR) repeat protein